MQALQLSRETFQQEVLESPLPILVDFWAPWCAPCVMMAPILDELAGELEGKIRIAKIDIEKPENKDLAIQYNIMSIPNMNLFKDGKVIKNFIGSRPKEQFKQELEAAIQGE
ncbi:MAG TPA: thioredoxin [Candidatus Moranbacteria bacterium]|nr:thioredoxin [Candidatus Moranbacteria bacterium]